MHASLIPTPQLVTTGSGEVLRNGKVPRSRCDPTPNGFVLEVEEQWRQGGEDWYAREMFRADVVGDHIVALSVYCTGDWDGARREQHAREVQLLRP